MNILNKTLTGIIFLFFGILFLSSCGGVSQKEHDTLKKKFESAKKQITQKNEEIKKINSDCGEKVVAARDETIAGVQLRIEAAVMYKLDSIERARQDNTSDTLNLFFANYVPGLEVDVASVNRNLNTCKDADPTSIHDFAHEYVSDISFVVGSQADLIAGLADSSLVEMVESKFGYVKRVAIAFGVRGKAKNEAKRWLTDYQSYSDVEEKAFKKYFEAVKDADYFDESNDAFKALKLALAKSQKGVIPSSTEVFSRYKPWAFWERRRIDGSEPAILKLCRKAKDL